MIRGCIPDNYTIARVCIEKSVDLPGREVFRKRTFYKRTNLNRREEIRTGKWDVSYSFFCEMPERE
jgi:hypothetical protein